MREIAGKELRLKPRDLVEHRLARQTNMLAFQRKRPEATYAFAVASVRLLDESGGAEGRPSPILGDDVVGPLDVAVSGLGSRWGSPIVTSQPARAAAIAVRTAPSEGVGSVDRVIGGEAADDGFGISAGDERRWQARWRGRSRVATGSTTTFPSGKPGSWRATARGVGRTADDESLFRRREGHDAVNRVLQERRSRQQRQQKLRPGGAAERPEAGPRAAGWDHRPKVE